MGKNPNFLLIFFLVGFRNQPEVLSMTGCENIKCAFDAFAFDVAKERIQAAARLRREQHYQQVAGGSNSA